MVNLTKVVVVGELHQDLFYKSSAFTDIAAALAKRILGSDLTEIKDPKSLESELLKIIDDTPKKIGCETYIKRGGNGNNSASLLAKIGIKTQLMTTVGGGTDWMRPELRSLGIADDTVYQVDAPGPISTIVEDPNITKIFIAPELKKAMNFEKVNIPDSAFDDAKIIFFTPIADKYTKVLQQTSALNKITAVTIETQKITNRIELEATMVVKSDFLFANLNDVASIIGLDTLDNSEPVIKERLLNVDTEYKQYADTRLYTLGKYGCWICDQDEAIQNIPIIKVEVKNRTGAGDTFAAGFIAAIFDILKDRAEFIGLSKDKRREILKQAAQFATAAASRKVATGETPTKIEIDSIVKENF